MAAVADLREGGRWTLAQRAKNDVLWLLAEGAVALTSRLPPRALRAVGAAVGALAHAAMPSARELARANVARALPELDAHARRALVRSSYRALGIELAETVSALHPLRPAPTLPFASGARQVVEQALAEGRGALLASAHLGPWERVAATLASAFPFTAVAREAYDPRLTRLVERVRRARGVRVVHRGAPGAAAGMLRTLRRGELLGIPMDLVSRVPTVEVPFLGHPGPTPVGPARLALRTGAAVLVGTVCPGPDGLVVGVRRIPTGDLPAGRSEAARTEAERALTLRINDELSARIRALPERWVWMHPRWPARTL